MSNKTVIFMRIYMTVLSVIAVSVMHISPVYGQSCAADFRNQIHNNALLAASRKVNIANTLIRKPDSVLEYSCFDQRAALVANDLGALFSESTRWDSQSITINGQFGDLTAVTYNSINYSVNMGSTHMDAIIDDLVFGTVNTFVNSNFSHSYWGGTTGTGSSSEDNNMGTNIAGAQNVCDSLYTVYDLVKCEDFADDRPFTEFSNWVGSDPRVLPAACSTATAITTALIEQANNAAFAHTAFDQVVTYNAHILPDTSPGADCALEPIPTGLMIRYREYDEDINGNTVVVVSYEYEDKVCPNPACYFDNNNDGDGTNDRCRKS